MMFELDIEIITLQLFFPVALCDFFEAALLILVFALMAKFQHAPGCPAGSHKRGVWVQYVYL